MAETGSEKTRIAILGGGISALTAAFELTEQDPDGSQFDITVYTLGWRLGGKAAVGAMRLNTTAPSSTACISGPDFTTTPSTL